MADIWPALHEKRYQLILSPAIIAETARKLRGKFRWEESRLQHSLRDIVKKAEIVQPKAIPNAVPNDPDDNHIIACALEGRADLIVSGDRDLLALGSYAGIPIVRPVDFLRTVS
jgi:putative PIN family toxin of toxin-antitoxin system